MFRSIDDAQIATRANYLLQTYGNPDARVYAELLNS